MVDPKIIYSCDHNLIEKGEKHKTIKILKSTDEVDKNSPTYDMFSVYGRIKSIDKIYAPKSQESISRINCRSSVVGCIYEEGIDYALSTDRNDSVCIISWIGNHPPENTYFYVDVTYDAQADIINTYDKLGFVHVAQTDVISNVPQDMQIIIIKSKSNIYIEDRDFSYAIEFGKLGERYSYNLNITWFNNPPQSELTALYFTSRDSFENDLSNNEIVDNENEDIPISMKRQLTGQLCPRCNGTGWYIGLFEKNCHRAKKANRLIQNFVKLMYTTASDSGQYLLNIAGSVVLSSEQDIRSILSSIIDNSVKRYLEMTREAKSRGVEISKSEQIYQAGLSDVSVYEDNTGVEVKVTIITHNGQTKTITIDT